MQVPMEVTRMPEQRMSLEEAGRLLGGLHPNTVRARAAKGKIRYEKDNSGKWFVFVDPEKAARDRAERQKLKAPKAELEAPLEPPIVSSFKALEATILVLNEELKASRVEREDLKVKLNERTEAAARLEVAMATLSAKSEAATEEVGRLRRRLEQETDENRKRLTEILEHMAARKLSPELEPTPGSTGQGEQEVRDGRDRCQEFGPKRRGWWPFRRRA
jgi:hypothetical protein